MRSTNTPRRGADHSIITAQLGLAVAAVLAALPTFAQAAAVSLGVTDAAGQSSFVTDTLSHWSPAGDPTAGNSYTVASGRTLRNVADSTGTVTFAGDSLTLGDGTTAGILTLKNLSGATVNVNNFTLNNGEIQAGGTAGGAVNSTTIGGNGITLAASATANRLNTGILGRELIIAAPISGSGSLNAINGGSVVLSNTNTYTGTLSVLTNTTVRAADGVGLSTGGNVLLNGGVLLLESNLTRTLGTNAGELQVTNGASGFAAFGANRTVNLSGGAALTWGSGGFAPSTLVLGRAAADSTLIFQNGIDLGATARAVQVDNGTAAVDAELSGAIVGTGALNVTGTGTLSLSSASNAFNGLNLNTNGGATVVRATASGAFGSGGIFIAGNAGSNRIELSGGITLNNAVAQNGKGNTAGQAASILNVSGDNTLGGTVTVQTGGSWSTIQSDAGKLTLSAATAVTTNATGSRNVTFRGTGDIAVTGAITNGTGAVGLDKQGAGTLSLSGPNAFSGPVALGGGKLVAASATALGTGATSVTGTGNTLEVANGVDVGGLTGLSIATGNTLSLVGGNTLSLASGVFSLGDVTLNLNNAFNAANTYTLIDGVDGANALGTPTLTGVDTANYTYAVAISGNDVVLTVSAVPEPATLGALAATGALFIRRRRRA